MFTKIKEPKKKYSKQKDLQVPLPIPCLNSNKNVENISKLLSSQYTAVLKEKQVRVEKEEQINCLYNCGFFGKGEYSRGQPILNEINKKLSDPHNPELNEFSLNQSDICMTMSNERYSNRKQWSNLLDSKEKIGVDHDFHSRFLNEFVENKTVILNNDDLKVKYCKVSSTNIIELDENEQKINPNQLLNTPNNPFLYKIKKIPKVVLNESLILMYEEAFFLCFGLGCLSVSSSTSITNSLSISELWKIFTEYDSEFPFKYAVYHKLRSKGWILKNGIKYGCEYMVYYEGPESYHASYGVVVRKKALSELNDLDNYDSQSFCQLSALLRINETVSKEVILCYVIYDKNVSVDFNSPECLKQISTLEILLNRWVPGNEKSLASYIVPNQTFDYEFNYD